MLNNVSLRVRQASWRTWQSFIILLAFLFNSFGSLPMAEADDFRLPAPGVMVHLSPEFNPPILKGLKVHPDNPFKFEFILDQGDSPVIPASSPVIPAKVGIHNQEQLKQEATRLIKYFLASLTIPEQDLWVNLSPYEKNRIIPQSFGLTEMGRDLLAEDYMLKQITASLIYPEGEVGKKFWKRVYAEAAKKFGTTNIPINTFNKVWIVPEKAVVYENAKAGTAYVVESKLKVMLEQDYLALEKNTVTPAKAGIQYKNNTNALNASSLAIRNETASIGANIVREIIIPELTKEVNEGKNFSQLRQAYNSLILATWYKKKIKDSILAQVYEDKNKIQGLTPTRGHGFSRVPKQVAKQESIEGESTPGKSQNDVEAIYQRYLQAFKKGAYNFIKEEIDPVTQETISRKYFSGGIKWDMAMIDINPMPNKFAPIQTNDLQLTVNLDAAMIGKLQWDMKTLMQAIRKIKDIRIVGSQAEGQVVLNGIETKIVFDDKVDVMIITIGDQHIPLFTPKDYNEMYEIRESLGWNGDAAMTSGQKSPLLSSWSESGKLLEKVKPRNLFDAIDSNGAFYRGVYGEEAFKDIIQSGLIRTNKSTEKSGLWGYLSEAFFWGTAGTRDRFPGLLLEMPLNLYKSKFGETRKPGPVSIKDLSHAYLVMVVGAEREGLVDNKVRIVEVRLPGMRSNKKRKEFDEAMKAEKDQAMISKIPKIKGKRFALIGSLVGMLAGTLGYLDLRYAHDLSWLHLLDFPESITLVDETNQVVYVDGKRFSPSEQEQKLIIDVDTKINKGEASEKFWRSIFTTLDEKLPVTQLIRKEHYQKLLEHGQLNDLLNVIRKDMKLTYRFISQMDEGYIREFSRYLLVVHPGIRQQILEHIYKGLKASSMVLNNGMFIKKLLTGGNYQRLKTQTERVRFNYSYLYAMLNRLEGPLHVSNLPDKPIAPIVLLPLTREESVNQTVSMFAKAIIEMNIQGYRVIMPAEKNVKLSEIIGFIGYEENLFNPLESTYPEDNQAGRLLAWVLQQTDPNPANPKAHRITEGELLQEAMELHKYPKSKTVDLFKVIGTIGHYYKAMARSPSIILTAAPTRFDEDGVDFIWNHHDPGPFFWSMDRNGVETVDDQGRPVHFWRPVNPDGLDYIPKGQRTGIKRMDTSHDFYHAWNIILTSFYVQLKSFSIIRKDRDEANTRYKYGEDLLVKRLWSIIRNRSHFDNEDMVTLPIPMKLAQLAELDDAGWDMLSFSQEKRTGENGSTAVFSRTGRELATTFIDSGSIRLDPNLQETVVDFPNLRSIEGGGIKFEDYVEQLNQRWDALSQGKAPNPNEWWRTLIAFEQVRLLQSDSFNLGSMAPLAPSTVKTRTSLTEYLNQLNAGSGVSPEIIRKVVNTLTEPNFTIKNLTSEYVQEALVTHHYTNVRDHLAMSENVKPSILEKLSEDRDLGIRDQVVKNRNIGIETLLKLQKDKDPLIADIALFRDPLTPLTEKVQLFHKYRKITTDDYQMNGIKSYINSYYNSIYNNDFLISQFFYIYENWRRANPMAVEDEIMNLIRQLEPLQRKYSAMNLDYNYYRLIYPTGDAKKDFLKIKELLEDWERNGVKRFTYPITPRKEDKAMVGNNEKGGIDLTPANMNLQVKVDSRFRGNDSKEGGNDRGSNGNGNGIKFHIDPAMLEQLQNAPGFTPVIIDIHPMTDLKQFLGIQENLSNNSIA